MEPHTLRANGAYPKLQEFFKNTEKTKKNSKGRHHNNLDFFVNFHSGVSAQMEPPDFISFLRFLFLLLLINFLFLLNLSPLLCFCGCFSSFLFCILLFLSLFRFLSFFLWVNTWLQRLLWAAHPALQSGREPFT